MTHFQHPRQGHAGEGRLALRPMAQTAHCSVRRQTVGLSVLGRALTIRAPGPTFRLGKAAPIAAVFTQKSGFS